MVRKHSVGTHTRMSRKNESVYVPDPEYGQILVDDEGQDLLFVAKEICEAFGEEALFVECSVDMTHATIKIWCAYSDGIDGDDIGIVQSVGEDHWEFTNLLTSKKKSVRGLPNGSEIFLDYDPELMARHGFYSTDESRRRVTRISFRR